MNVSKLAGALSVFLALACGAASGAEPAKADASRKASPSTDSATAAKIETPKFVKNLKARKKQHIAVFGCSLTSRNEWPTLLKAELDKRWPGLTTFTNVAASGMQISWATHNVKPRVTDTKADVVFVEFGINDARDNRMSPETVKSLVGSTVKQIQEGLPGVEVILMTMNGATGNQGRRRPNQANIYQAYVDYAAENGLLCINHYPNWQKSIADGKFGQYCPDTLHPVTLGYQEVFMPEMIKMLNLDAKEPKTMKPGRAYNVPAAKQEQRTWTSSTGKTIEAKLVKVSGGKAYLVQADGKAAVIALEKLSEADKAYVEDRVGE